MVVKAGSMTATKKKMGGSGPSPKLQDMKLPDAQNQGRHHSECADILVSNLPPDAAALEIEEFFADAGPVRKVNIKQSGKAIIHFVLAADAQRCLDEMSGRQLRGQRLGLSFFEAGEQISNPTKQEPVNPRLFRLIVRNLPFGVKEAAVRSVFEDFGRLLEVHLPTKQGPDGAPTGRGFGFLQYSSKKEAKEAVEKGNGIDVLGRPVAVDWALGKEFYQAVAGPPKSIEKDKSAGSGKPITSEHNLDGSHPISGVVSSAKRKITDVQKEPLVTDKEQHQVPCSQASENTSKKAKKGKDESVSKRRDETSRGDADNGGDKESAGDHGGKDGSSTAAVFVRNIPLEATEAELKELMRRFGPVRWCRLVVDKSTLRHKGTAFVHFLSPAAAEAAVRAGAAFTGSDEWERLQQHKDKRNSSVASAAAGPHVRGVLQRADGGGGGGGGEGEEFAETLRMHGRHLFVAPAVAREDAERLAGREVVKMDRRNVYLAREGLILPDSPAAKTCSPADLNKRLRDWQEKKKKLANTNFFVSRTRLSVRNLAKDVTDTDLKSAFLQAATIARGSSTPKSHVSSGAKAQGTAKMPKSSGASGSEPAAAEVGAPPRVLVAKVMRDKERVEAESGKGASKGYGFVEFDQHADALAALRRINNCAAAAKSWNGGKRPMVDFVVEDARAVRERRIRLARLERARARRAQARRLGADGQEGNDEEGTEKARDKLGRGAKQRLKKKTARGGDRGEEDENGADEAHASGADRVKHKNVRQIKAGGGAKKKEDRKGPASAGENASHGADARRRPTSEASIGEAERSCGAAAVGRAKQKRDSSQAHAAVAAATTESKGGADSGGVAKRRRVAVGGVDGGVKEGLDGLVADVDGMMAARGRKAKGQGRTGGKRSGKGGEDGLESLVEKYRAKLFGGGGGASDKRWFE